MQFWERLSEFLCTKKQELLLLLFKTLDRPKLEYCMQAWKPHLKTTTVCLKGTKKVENWIKLHWKRET